jgi:hypothetical protein
MLRDRELAAHMLVAGGTQAGKSTLIKRHIEGVRRLGHAVLVLDGKADPQIAAFFRALDPHARIWTPSNHGPPLHLLAGLRRNSPPSSSTCIVAPSRTTGRSITATPFSSGTYFARSGEARTPASVVRLLVSDKLDAAAGALSTRLQQAGLAAGADAALTIATYTADLLKDSTRRPCCRWLGGSVRRHC